MEYLSFLTSVKIVIENMSKHLPPPLPSSYRGVEKEIFGGCLLTYMNEEMRAEKVTSNGEKPFVVHYGDGDFNYYAQTHPFVLGFIKLYNKDLFEELEDYQHQRRVIEPALVRVRSNCLDDIRTKITANSIAPGVPAKTSTYHIPVFTIRNSQLGYWQASFDYRLKSQLQIKNYRPAIELYFSLHPEKSKEIDAVLAPVKAEQKKRESMKLASRSAKDDIDRINALMTANNSEIQNLEKKIFGRSKAQEQIALLKTKNHELSIELNKAESIIKKYEEVSTAPLMTTADETKILEMVDWCIPWQWTDPMVGTITNEGADKSAFDTTNRTIAATETVQGHSSAANEIREFKKLLDDGIITQEEFDAKKKQILGIEISPRQQYSSTESTLLSIPADNWKCPKCGRINKNHVIRCECGARNVNSSVQNTSATTPEGCWKCPKCGKINKNHVIRCECGARNVKFSL